MTMQRPSPILVAERFPRLLDALLELMRGLTDQEWQMPTALDGWNVKDVAAHLVGDEMNILSGKRDGYREPHAPIPDWDALVAFINRRNHVWVEATRRLSPQLLIDLLRFSGDQANQFFQSLDPMQMGGPVNWAGDGPAPVWLDIAREFTERWHHQQHIRDAVGKPGGMEPYFLKPVLAAFMHALPQTYKDVAASEGTQIAFRIRGESGGAWTVVREGGGWQLYSGSPETFEAEELPEAQIELPEDTAWRLLTKGIDAKQARASAALAGDAALAERALETIAIIA